MKCTYIGFEDCMNEAVVRDLPTSTATEYGGGKLHCACFKHYMKHKSAWNKDIKSGRSEKIEPLFSTELLRHEL